MFNKNLFDRSVYNRSVASDSVNSAFIAFGKMGTGMIMVTPMPIQPLIGRGDLSSGVRILIPAGTKIESSGGLNNSSVILRQALTIGINGSGTLNPQLTMITPIGSGTNIGGSSTVPPIKSFVYQHMGVSMAGDSQFTPALGVQQLIDIILDGSSLIKNDHMILRAPLTFNLNGRGDQILRRLGTLNEDLFQLLDINLEPGEEVTIDTDLFEVLFGYIPDVSSVTSDSVFFDLNPGGNEVTISTDTQEQLQITAIWQNRWL